MRWRLLSKISQWLLRLESFKAESVCWFDSRLGLCLTVWKYVIISHWLEQLTTNFSHAECSEVIGIWTCSNVCVNEYLMDFYVLLLCDNYGMCSFFMGCAKFSMFAMATSSSFCGEMNVMLFGWLGHSTLSFNMWRLRHLWIPKMSFAVQFGWACMWWCWNTINRNLDMRLSSCFNSVIQATKEGQLCWSAVINFDGSGRNNVK